MGFSRRVLALYSPPPWEASRFLGKSPLLMSPELISIPETRWLLLRISERAFDLVQQNSGCSDSRRSRVSSACRASIEAPSLR
jgi:hypothetical protein